MKNVISALLPIPRFVEPREEVKLPHARKVFPLRNLHFRDIKALGFDMDYTLSHYRSPEIDELAYRHSARLLVRERDYPAWLLDTHFDPGLRHPRPGPGRGPGQPAEAGQFPPGGPGLPRPGGP